MPQVHLQNRAKNEKARESKVLQTFQCCLYFAVLRISQTMDDMKYSIAVKLVGHESDVVQGYSVARYLVANEPIGRWMRGILEGNDSNWLLGIILRHPDVSKRRSNVCLVRCDKHNHLLVTLNGANVPTPGTLIPTVSIDLFLAMNHGGNFLDDKMQEFGVLKDGSLFDHIRSAIDSGFNLGDLRLYVHPKVHGVNEMYTDSTDGGRLVRFYFKPGSWSLSRDVLNDDLHPHVSSNTVSFGSATPLPVVTEDHASMKSQKKKFGAELLAKPTPAKTSQIAASSCFYAPFCNKYARDCGGLRKGLCNEVNSGKIKIPNDEEFLEEKRKMRSKLKKERRAKAKDLALTNNVGKTTGIYLDASTTTKPLDTFNPREYILLCKAWNGELTQKDVKDTGERYTEQDCYEAAKLLTC